MDISLIILNWNGREHLEDCLAAVDAQRFRDFETIMVDNASQDGSVALVRKKFPWVRLVELTENRGFAGGNAAGLAVAQGAAIVLLNNDTAPDPDWLTALVAAAEADSRRGVVASLVVDWSGALIDSAGDGMRVTGIGYQRFHGRPRANIPVSGPVFSACGCAVLYRRAMLAEVGFLDERFFMNGEDTDLCFRGRLAGWEVWYCAEAVVRHRISASQGANSAASVYFHERNRYWSVMKCMPAGLFWKYSWVYALELGARGLYFLRRGRFFAWLRGVLAGLGGVFFLLAERRRIQSHRRVKPAEIERYFLFPRVLGGNDETPLARP